MTIHILGGGTFNHVRSHLALATPAFGGTARWLYHMYDDKTVKLHLTKMASQYSQLVTNEDVSRLVDEIIADSDSKIVYFNVALCDYDGSVAEYDGVAPYSTKSGKYEDRLKTSEGNRSLILSPADKIIGRLRKERKDLFVVGFKTTTNATPDEQYIAGLNLLKANSINLVLANDTVTRNNIIIAPEETRWCNTTDRGEALTLLKTMTDMRSKCTFTRSTVENSFDLYPWSSGFIPDTLRTVVDHCIERGAYKPFRGATAGHFAVKTEHGTVLTSVRKSNYNDLHKEGNGLVEIEYDGLDKVIAYGAKPSVGGQSQRIIFDEHPDVDCIVHFHCPIKKGREWDIHVASQSPYECGSHQCGENTSKNLKDYDGIKSVMLDNHGPNIVFSRKTDPQKVIDFIETNFDLEQKTGGFVDA